MARLNQDFSNIAPAQGEHDVPQTAIARVWSPYQQAIFNFIVNGTGSAIIEAVAGSGKSATVEHGCTLVRGSYIVLAFNKPIADEMKARGLNARTFHSLTFTPVMRARNQRNPETNKLRKLCDEHMSVDEERMYGTFACRMVGLARNMGIGCLVPDTEDAWVALCEHHNIELESEDADLGRAIELSRDLLGWSNRSPLVDFDDMLYFAVKDGIALPKFDFVFVDEAQDTNAIQRAIIRKIMHPRSRLIAVGDPAQAIYGFRGADSDSINLIASEFKAVTLPLSITYRCPVKVVEYARQWVQHIEPKPGAAEGVVQELGTEWKVSDFQGGVDRDGKTPVDLVVSRKTAPLIALAYQFIRERKPVTVLGREIGAGLKSLIKKMNARGLDHLEQKLRAYLDRETEKLRAKRDDAKIEALEDKVGSLLFLIEGLGENHRTIPALEREIDALFEAKVGAVQLCTIHKSKGLEALRVWWLGRAECPAQWARQDWQRQQEVNLCYVAATRAKTHLFTFELKTER